MPLGAARFGLLGGVADLGKLELIETQTANNVNFLDFTSIQESTYNVHFVTVTNLQATGSSTSAYVQLFESGVIETGSVYQYAYQEQDLGTATVTENKSTSATTIGIDYDFDPATPRNNYFYLYNAGDSSKYTFSTWHSNQPFTSSMTMFFGSGVMPYTSTVDGIRINVNTGTLTGQASLYGIKEYS